MMERGYGHVTGEEGTQEVAVWGPAERAAWWVVHR